MKTVIKLPAIIGKAWFSDTFATSLWCANMGIVAGLWVASGIACHAPPFLLLGQIIPLHVWGAWFVACGALQLNAAWRGRRWMRAATSLCGFINWTYLAGTTLLIDARAIVWLTYACFAAMWGWVFWRTPGGSIAAACPRVKE